MKIYIYYFLIFVYLVLILGCPGKKDFKQNYNETNNVSNLTQKFDIFSIITIKPGTKIELNSVEKFIQLWILYNLEQKKWLKSIEESSNQIENIEDYLSKKRVEFYKSFGITEDEFIQYSINNFKEINNFLEKNPDYKRAFQEATKE